MQTKNAWKLAHRSRAGRLLQLLCYGILLLIIDTPQPTASAIEHAEYLHQRNALVRLSDDGVLFVSSLSCDLPETVDLIQLGKDIRGRRVSKLAMSCVDVTGDLTAHHINDSLESVAFNQVRFPKHSGLTNLLETQRSIRSIYLCNMSFSPDDLRAVAFAESLQSLEILQCRLNEMELPPFQDASQLRSYLMTQIHAQ